MFSVGVGLGPGTGSVQVRIESEGAVHVSQSFCLDGLMCFRLSVGGAAGPVGAEV